MTADETITYYPVSEDLPKKAHKIVFKSRAQSTREAKEKVNKGTPFEGQIFNFTSWCKET